MEKWLWWFRPVLPGVVLLQLLEMSEWGKQQQGKVGEIPVPFLPYSSISSHFSSPLWIQWAGWAIINLFPSACLGLSWTFIIWFCSQCFGRSFCSALCSVRTLLVFLWACFHPWLVCDGGGQTAHPCPSLCAAHGFLDWIIAVTRSSVFRLKTLSFHYFFIRGVMLDLCHPKNVSTSHVCVYIYFFMMRPLNPPTLGALGEAGIYII